MPRIRSLKIGFFTNETLCELSPWHRLLFGGLWLLADREGRLEDRPRRIKAQLFPYDDLNMDQLLADLASHGFIVRYTADGAGADGAQYLAIVKFAIHQRPKSDELVSAIPAPNLEIPRGIMVPPRISPLGKDRGQRTEGRGQREEEAADGAAGADAAPSSRNRADDFADLWNTETKPPIARCRDLTTKRRRQIRSRLTEYPLTEWGAVFRRIQASAFCRGENDRGWRASFDWVIGSPDVGVKVLEGKYDDRQSSGVNKNTAGVIAALHEDVRYD